MNVMCEIIIREQRDNEACGRFDRRAVRRKTDMTHCGNDQDERDRKKDSRAGRRQPANVVFRSAKERPFAERKTTE